MAKAKRGEGGKHKLRAYFISKVGEVVSTQELQEISGYSAEFGRRIRELRGEEGMNILSHRDRDDLRPGQYILTDLKIRPAFERSISKQTRAIVLDRNGHTCRMCGAVAGEPHPYDTGKRTRLHIGHIIDKSQGGTDDASNLWALCSVCNEGVSNISPPRPDAQALLIAIRRSAALDQKEVLKWIVGKFPEEAIRIAEKSLEERSKNKH